MAKKVQRELTFGMIATFFFLVILLIAAALIVPKVLESKANNKRVETVKSELFDARNLVNVGIKKLDVAPRENLVLKFSPPKWSFTYLGINVASGSVSGKNQITGFIYTDRSYCVQIANPDLVDVWHMDENSKQPETGFCVGKRAVQAQPQDSLGTDYQGQPGPRQTFDANPFPSASASSELGFGQSAAPAQDTFVDPTPTASTQPALVNNAVPLPTPTTSAESK